MTPEINPYYEIHPETLYPLDALPIIRRSPQPFKAYERLKPLVYCPPTKS